MQAIPSNRQADTVDKGVHSDRSNPTPSKQTPMTDGEIIIATDRRLDFEALQQRIHPADSRVQMLAKKTL